MRRITTRIGPVTGPVSTLTWVMVPEPGTTWPPPAPAEVHVHEAAARGAPPKGSEEHPSRLVSENWLSGGPSVTGASCARAPSGSASRESRASRATAAVRATLLRCEPAKRMTI